MCAVTAVYLTITFSVAAFTDDCTDIPDYLGCAEPAEASEIGFGLQTEVIEQPACEWIVHHVCKQHKDKPVPNRFSPAATLFLSSGEEVVKLLFTSPKLGFDIGALHLAGFLCVYFTFACWSAGMIFIYVRVSSVLTVINIIQYYNQE